MPINGAVHNECFTICNAMGSVAEAEVGGLYVNCQWGEELRTALQEMGHLQPPTIIITDDSMTDGIVNSHVKQCRTRAMDMRLYWIKVRIK
eukprot:5937207-Ditylum_brightwellii.AAC.1